MNFGIGNISTLADICIFDRSLETSEALPLPSWLPPLEADSPPPILVEATGSVGSVARSARPPTCHTPHWDQFIMNQPAIFSSSSQSGKFSSIGILLGSICDGEDLKYDIMMCAKTSILINHPVCIIEIVSRYSNS